MDLTVNGKNFPIDVRKESTFEGVMRTIYSQVVNPENVIYKVAVNGEFISEERERLLGQLPKEDIESIEVTTKHPLDLAHETMGTGLEYVSRLTEALREIITVIRADNTQKVDEEKFQACIEGLQWFFLMIEGLKGPLHLTQDAKITQTKTISILESESASAINELCDAREKEDKPGMADAIEYELIPTLETWRQWLVRNTDVEVAMRDFEKRKKT